MKALTNKILEYVRGNYAKKSDIPVVSNDLTDNLKEKYDDAYIHSQKEHAPVNAEENVINSITVNNVEIKPDSNKNVAITISQMQELTEEDIDKIVEEVIAELESK